MNKGSCCTPKFSLSFIKRFLTRSPLTQDCIRVDQLKTPHQTLMTKIRVWVCTKIFELSMPHMTFMDHYGPPRLLMPSCKLWITFFISQLSSWPKKSVVLGKKSTMANLQSNFIIFDPHQHFKLICIIWSSLDHNSSRNLIRSSKGQNGQN